MRTSLPLCAFVFSLFVICQASAQTLSTSADLEGTVTDATDARIPGATVTIVREATGEERVVVTDAEGRFEARMLRVGEYRVAVRADGFEPYHASAIVLNLGSRIDVDVRLTVTGVKYDEIVRAAQSLEDVQRSGLGGVITTADLRMLPSDSRNPLAFALLAPGAAVDRTSQQGASRTSGFVFSGQRARANSIVVDGTDFNDQVVGGIRGSIGHDAVEEFQVLTNGFSAELGKASGGVVNVVTRGGTNMPSGGAFLAVRDDALAAKNYFERHTPAGARLDRPKAPYRSRQFAASFGGPLQRDRTFLFGAIERRTIDGSNLVVIDEQTPVPHPLIAGATLGTAVDILRRAGFPVETGQVPYRVQVSNWLLRLDHQLSASHRVNLRVNGATELNENIEPFGGLVARSRGAVLDSSDLMANASHLWVIGRRAGNELRVFVARHDQVTQALDPLCSGECDLVDEGGPTVEVTGVASVGRHRFTPTPRDDTRYQIVDRFSVFGPRHTLKFGIDANIIVGRTQSLPLHFGGRYIFSPLPPLPGLPVAISSIQALALGLPAAYVQGYGEPAFEYDTGDLSAFIEDVWTPGGGVSLRYGIRYQRQYWPTVSFRVPGIPDAFPFPSDNNDLAPRLAASWAITPNSVVRGGYGLYYDSIITVVPGVTHAVSGQSDGIRTAVMGPPASFAAWAAPGHRLSESAAVQLRGGPFPSLVIAVDPGLRTSYSHQAFATIERRVRSAATVSLTATFARGLNQLGTLDYNPIVPALGTRRRPGDVNGVAGTSASVLQYTAFGETWYRGLTAAVDAQLPSRTAVRASYTLSKAEDTSADFQSAFLPEDNGRGRDPQRPTGLPIGFDPARERGPSVSDQRHRLVVVARSELPGAVHVGTTIIASSGWPYNVLAGEDLNGDGDGGAFPSDRARRDPGDPATALGRNSGRLPAQAEVNLRITRPIGVGTVRLEPLLDIFNLFNRTNFIDVQKVFGRGAYPANPAPAFGQFTEAGPGRQIQLGVRVEF